MDTRGALEIVFVVVVIGGLAVHTALGNSDTGPTESGVEAEIREAVNEERVAHGREPLEQSEEIAKVASGHSENMAANDFYSHEAPDGDRVGDRYDEGGVMCSRGAENIYHLQYGGPFYNETELAESAVNSWMNSPGHRRSLLSKDYDEQGIGVAIIERSGERHLYVTQNFCG